MVTAAELIGFIRELVVQQNKIVATFRKAYPNVRDWEFLLGFPVSGEINVDGIEWSFEKHGAGLSFKSSHGVVIDIHRAFGQPDVFDAWRLLQYLESFVPRVQFPATEAELETTLEELRRMSQIERAKVEGGFRLQ